MKSFVDGSKYFVFSLKGFHWVSPFLVLSSISRHSKLVPYGVVSNPRCVLYHSLIAFGSLDLKKIPPIPVTFFIFAFLFLFEIIVLKAKPNRNEVAISAIVNVVRFMRFIFLSNKYFPRSFRAQVNFFLIFQFHQDGFVKILNLFYDDRLLKTDTLFFQVT